MGFRKSINQNCCPDSKSLRFNFFKLFIVLFFTSSNYGQEIPENFKNSVDSLIRVTPETYSEMDKVLRPFRKDTLLMRYFNTKARQNNYLDGQAYALNQIGRTYRSISEFSKALISFQKALEVSRKSENIEFQVYSLNMISVVFRRTDAIKSALDYSQEALELAETVKNPSVGLKRSINVSLNSIGNIYQILEQYDLAIEKFKQSMRLEKELENKLGLAINHQNVGECYEAQGKLEEALHNFQKSLAYNIDIDSDKGKIICNYSIAHVYVHLGKMQEALKLLNSALVAAKPLGDQKIISSIFINLGWTYIQLNKYDLAENNLTEGLGIAQQYNLPAEIAESNKFLSELWIKKDDFKKGMAFYKEAKKYEEQITNNLNLRYVNDMILRYESEKRASQLETLAKENETVRLKLRKNRTMLLISGIGLALLAGILYILYRQYQLNNEKKLLTLEQTMLRSQMNPHFLFNSLNSIKLYIINNEKKNAVHYLNKFSKLVRKILEASSQREIPLAEELETVELYMNIENIRFSNEINFKIKVDETLDVHTIRIPSLILQPFLENALWHGLSSKDGEKNIVLEVMKAQEGFIKISIIDDGKNKTREGPKTEICWYRYYKRKIGQFF
jgi:tetratricopeptide (TPR) repeat protein